MSSNIETTKQAYDLFKRGEIPTLVTEIIDDDCTWISPGPKDKLPWVGQFKGKAGVADFFSRLAANIDFSEFAPQEMIEKDDTVVVIGTLSARMKATGKTINDD